MDPILIPLVCTSDGMAALANVYITVTRDYDRRRISLAIKATAAPIARLQGSSLLNFDNTWEAKLTS